MEQVIYRWYKFYKEKRVEYEGFSYIEPASIFHVISDQNSRSIVQYDCGDFLLGDYIHRVEQLSREIDSGFRVLPKNIITKLKELQIESGTSPLLDLITDSVVHEILKDFVNTKSKEKNNKTVDSLNLLSYFGGIDLTEEEDQTLLVALQKDIAKKDDSLIRKIKELATQMLSSISGFKYIDAQSEAITILERFKREFPANR